jgi:hypothetical protein
MVTECACAAAGDLQPNQTPESDNFFSGVVAQSVDWLLWTVTFSWNYSFWS